MEQLGWCSTRQAITTRGRHTTTRESLHKATDNQHSQKENNELKKKKASSNHVILEIKTSPVEP